MSGVYKGRPAFAPKEARETHGGDRLLREAVSVQRSHPSASKRSTGPASVMPDAHRHRRTSPSTWWSRPGAEEAGGAASAGRVGANLAPPRWQPPKPKRRRRAGQVRASVERRPRCRGLPQRVSGRRSTRAEAGASQAPPAIKVMAFENGKADPNAASNPGARAFSPASLRAGGGLCCAKTISKRSAASWRAKKSCATGVAMVRLGVISEAQAQPILLKPADSARSSGSTFRLDRGRLHLHPRQAAQGRSVEARRLSRRSDPRRASPANRWSGLCVRRLPAGPQAVPLGPTPPYAARGVQVSTGPQASLIAADRPAPRRSADLPRVVGTCRNAEGARVARQPRAGWASWKNAKDRTRKVSFGF